MSAQVIPANRTVHVEQFNEVLDEAFRQSARTFDRYRIQFVVLTDEFRDEERGEHMDDVVIRAGAWGRWYVRGALDPTYAEPSQRDLAVQVLAHRGHHDAAGALLAGWVGRTALEVTRG